MSTNNNESIVIDAETVEVIELKEEVTEVNPEVTQGIVEDLDVIESEPIVTEVVIESSKKSIKKDIVLSQSVLVTLYTNAEEFAANPSKIRVRIIAPEEFDLIGDKINRKRFVIFVHTKWALGQFKRSGKTYIQAKAGDSWLVDIIKYKQSIYAVPVELADIPVKK